MKSVPGEFKRKNQHFICARSPSVRCDVCRRAVPEVTFRVCRQPGGSAPYQLFLLSHHEKLSISPHLSWVAMNISMVDGVFSSPTHACFRQRSSRAIMDCASSKRRLSFEHQSLSFLLLQMNFRSAVSLRINVLLCSRENIYGSRNIFCWWNKLKENTLKWISISITHSQVFGFYWITISSLIETQMVVLEGANDTMPMLTIGNTQYLQPDYLSPNPTMVGFIWKNCFSTAKIISDFFLLFNSWIRRKARWHCWPRRVPKSALTPTA